MSRGQGLIRLVVARPTLLLSIVLLMLSLASALLTAWQQIDPQRGGSLASLFVIIAAVIPVAENQLRGYAQRGAERWKREDAQLEKEVGQRAQARSDLLNEIRRKWLDTEPEQSPGKLGRLDLRLVLRSGAVDDQFRSFFRRPHEPDRLLEPGTPIAAIYRDVGSQLLILGSSGSGKTTLLLEIARDLVEGAIKVPTRPIPVYFHLSSWAVERQPLADWLVGELHKLYNVNFSLSRYWVNREQIAPLLDGLDEVPTQQRDACLEAINKFHDDHGQMPLVVCCRTDEYEALRARIRLRGAVVIQPLTRVDVERYLRQAGRLQAGFRAALREDEQLFELVTTPLLLRVIALSYQSKPATAVRASGTLEERRQRALHDYVNEMLSRPRPSVDDLVYSDEQTVSWLAWLARAMKAHGQSLFYLDWMQPDWLPTKTQRRLVTVGVAVAAGLACGLTSALGAVLLNASELSERLTDGLGSGLVFGLIVGLVAYQSTISPTERLHWSLAGVLRRLPRLLGAGLLGGALFALVFGLIYIALVGHLGVEVLITILIAGPLGFGILGALVTGLVFGPVSGLQPQLNVTPAAPGKGMQTSKRNALVGGLVGGLLGALAGGLLGGLIGGPIAELVRGHASGQQNVALVLGLDNGLDFALVFGLTAWLRRGGGAVLRHHALRRLLVRNGFAPNNYVAFLDYVSGLILMRRRGGGYEFMHRLLLEYFAQPGL